MSQFFIEPPGGAPAIATQFTGDIGVAEPTGNNLNIKARDTFDDNDNGIRTNVDPDGGPTLYVELTNRTTVLETLTNSDEVILREVDLGTEPGVYTFYGSFLIYNTTIGSGALITYNSLFKTTGAVASEISAEIQDTFVEVPPTGSIVSIAVEDNSVAFIASGIVGQEILISLLIEYRKLVVEV